MYILGISNQSTCNYNWPVYICDITGTLSHSELACVGCCAKKAVNIPELFLSAKHIKGPQEAGLT